SSTTIARGTAPSVPTSWRMGASFFGVSGGGLGGPSAAIGAAPAPASPTAAVPTGLFFSPPPTSVPRPAARAYPFPRTRQKPPSSPTDVGPPTFQRGGG